MADVLPSELVNSVMGKLYDILANGDETVPKSEDNFFSWCTPGLPVDPEDFEFLKQGLTGVVKKRDIAEMSVPTAPADGAAAAPAPGSATTPELTPALLDQLRGADTARLYAQAEALARLVDLVVDVTAANNSQIAKLSILNNEGSLSDVYQHVLRMSQVMQSELPEETKKKIEKFRDLLTVKTTKKNLSTTARRQSRSQARSRRPILRRWLLTKTLLSRTTLAELTRSPPPHRVQSTTGRSMRISFAAKSRRR